MLSEYPLVHFIEINHIYDAEEGGWEFICHRCGYRARYIVSKAGVQRLEILSMGDTRARHISGQILFATGDDSEIPDPCGSSDECMAGASHPSFGDHENDRLPPHVQAQIEAIVRKYF